MLGAVGEEQDDDAACDPNQAHHLERVGAHALGQWGCRVGAHAARLCVAQPKEPRCSLWGKGAAKCQFGQLMLQRQDLPGAPILQWHARYTKHRDSKFAVIQNQIGTVNLRIIMRVCLFFH